MLRTVALILLPLVLLAAACGGSSDGANGESDEDSVEALGPAGPDGIYNTLMTTCLVTRPTWTTRRTLRPPSLTCKKHPMVSGWSLFGNQVQFSSGGSPNAARKSARAALLL